MSPDRFARIFDVLEILAATPQGLTVTEVGRDLGLPISSTHNLLQRMVRSEAVTVADGLRYSLGPRAVRLGIRVVDGLEVRTVARRHLQELARRTGDDVYLGVRLGRRVVYIDRITGRRPVAVDIRLGQSLFLHATSVGKLFSAHEPQLRQRLWRDPRPRLTEHTLTARAALERELDRILDQGVAISRQEAIEGIVGFAVPVFGAEGDLVAAIHISALRAQATRSGERELVAAASASAAAIERDLGRLPSSLTTRNGGGSRRSASRRATDQAAVDSADGARGARRTGAGKATASPSRKRSKK